MGCWPLWPAGTTSGVNDLSHILQALQLVKEALLKAYGSWVLGYLVSSKVLCFDLVLLACAMKENVSE